MVVCPEILSGFFSSSVSQNTDRSLSRLNIFPYQTRRPLSVLLLASFFRRYFEFLACFSIPAVGAARASPAAADAPRSHPAVSPGWLLDAWPESALLLGELSPSPSSLVLCFGLGLRTRQDTSWAPAVGGWETWGVRARCCFWQPTPVLNGF